MAAQNITKDDLRAFKVELLADLSRIIKESQPDTPITKKWLKSYEVRKILNISAGTLQNLRVNGSLAFTKIGGTMYYENEDVKEMLEINKQKNQRKQDFS